MHDGGGENEEDGRREDVRGSAHILEVMHEEELCPEAFFFGLKMLGLNDWRGSTCSHAEVGKVGMRGRGNGLKQQWRLRKPPEAWAHCSSRLHLPFEHAREDSTQQLELPPTTVWMVKRCPPKRQMELGRAIRTGRETQWHIIILARSDTRWPRTGAR